MAHTHRKPPGRNLGHRSQRFTVLKGGDQAPALAVPPCPDGLLEASQDAWQTFWNSQVAQVIDPASDLPAIVQWVQLHDEEARLQQDIDRVGFMVEGSMGQPVLNPLYQLRAQLRAELHRLRSEFGMTPAARLRLGLALGELTLQRQRIDEGNRHHRPPLDDDDRRAAILDDDAQG